jgi:hypothetical protein
MSFDLILDCVHLIVNLVLLGVLFALLNALTKHK